MKFMKTFGIHVFSLTKNVFGDILGDTLASVNTMCRWYNEDESGRDRERGGERGEEREEKVASIVIRLQ